MDEAAGVLVGVIDSAQTRREKVVEGFTNACVSAVELRQYWEGAYPKSASDLQARMLLVHYGDQKALLGISPFNPLLVVYYGGNGEPDIRWSDPPSKTAVPSECIWRAIGQDGGGVLTQDEVRQLLNYAQTVGASHPLPKPVFLQPPSGCDTLMALSILCQGYQVISAKHGCDKGIPECVRQAVRQFREVATPLRVVQEHAFWAVFDEKDTEQLVKAAAAEWATLKGEGNLEDVTTLIRGLPTKTNPLKNDDISMVVAAYNGIAARMEASCE